MPNAGVTEVAHHSTSDGWRHGSYGGVHGHVETQHGPSLIRWDHFREGRLKDRVDQRQRANHRDL